METEFTRPDRKQRLAQLGYLFKHSFTIVGRERAILSPIIRMVIYAMVMVLLFFIGIYLAAGEGGGSTWFLLAGSLMFIYKFFYYNRAELTLSRMIYETAIGNTPEGPAVRREIADLKAQIRILGALDMVSAWVESRKNKAGGLMTLLLGGIVQIWDLVNNFLLPVFAIEKVGIRDGLAQMKRLKDHVPETLAGVFGINILGGVVGTLMAPFHGGGIIIGIGAGLLLGERMPAAFSGGELHEWFAAMPELGPIGPETVFNWLPLFVVVFLGFLLHGLLGRVVTALKVIYFTLFYIRIAHPERLTADLRADLEGYLEMQEQGMEAVPA